MAYRNLIESALCIFATALCLPGIAIAQSSAYPYAAEQGTDVAARYIADLLSKSLGFLKNEREVWGNVIRSANIKID